MIGWVVLNIDAVAKHMNKFLEIGNIDVEDGVMSTSLGKV